MYILCVFLELYTTATANQIFNPRHMRCRVTVVVLSVCVCVSVTTKSAAYLIYVENKVS